MKEFSCNEIKKVISIIMKNNRLRDKLFVSGGIVPWLMSGKDSGRMHGDIDLIANQTDMDMIRKVLKEYNLYIQELDSLLYKQSEGQKDYGLGIYFRNIPIGIYPYELTESGVLIQRSFSAQEVSGKPDLKIKEFPDMATEDYLTHFRLPNGLIIGSSTLEIIKATKLKANRGKDKIDISQIDSIGIDEERYRRVLNSVGKMKSTLDDRKKDFLKRINYQEPFSYIDCINQREKTSKEIDENSL